MFLESLNFSVVVVASEDAHETEPLAVRIGRSQGKLAHGRVFRSIDKFARTARKLSFRQARKKIYFI
jgi:hypothetical protein